MSRSHRIEKDSLGEVRVPADALYGAQTQRAAENFPISGRRFTRRFIEALGRLKEAAAETNAELGLVPGGLARAIGAAAREVADGAWDDHFPARHLPDRIRHLHQHERQRGDRGARQPRPRR